MTVFPNDGTENVLFIGRIPAIIPARQKGGVVYFRIEGSDLTSGRAVCRVTEAMDESAAQQWAVDVARIRISRIVTVAKPVWVREEARAQTTVETPVEGRSLNEEGERHEAVVQEVGQGEAELMSPRERVWSAALNERWESQPVASSDSSVAPIDSAGPLLPLPQPAPERGRLPEPITGGLLASMREAFAAPREPFTPIQLALLGLISLDVCAVVGLMLRGPLGAEPVSGVVQLYLFATLVNLPALAALLVGWIYSKRTGNPRPARQMSVAFFVLLARVFVVTVALTTGQLTTRETMAQQARVRNSHRPSIARERAMVNERQR
jgi:hypothetical protein